MFFAIALPPVCVLIVQEKIYTTVSQRPNKCLSNSFWFLITWVQNAQFLGHSHSFGLYIFHYTTCTKQDNCENNILLQSQVVHCTYLMEKVYFYGDGNTLINPITWSFFQRTFAIRVFDWFLIVILLQFQILEIYLYIMQKPKRNANSITH